MKPNVPICSGGLHISNMNTAIFLVLHSFPGPCQYCSKRHSLFSFTLKLEMALMSSSVNKGVKPVPRDANWCGFPSHCHHEACPWRDLMQWKTAVFGDITGRCSRSHTTLQSASPPLLLESRLQSSSITVFYSLIHLWRGHFIWQFLETFFASYKTTKNGEHYWCLMGRESTAAKYPKVHSPSQQNIQLIVSVALRLKKLASDDSSLRAMPTDCKQSRDMLSLPSSVQIAISQGDLFHSNK